MKRRRPNAKKTAPPPAAASATPLPPAGPSEEEALVALLASALEAQARRREPDLPAELAAADLLRSCLVAASLAEGEARDTIARTAREAFTAATKKPAPTRVSRGRAA
ncbi:MAG TPA: hypothetical protein VFS00_16615 [Polyangiaceae bacterium]|nr:hypothetical protein [Polyangiaceae bacterium]